MARDVHRVSPPLVNVKIILEAVVMKDLATFCFMPIIPLGHDARSLQSLTGFSRLCNLLSSNQVIFTSRFC